ncbi:hypothetical protein SAMN05444166_5444 [Singulisphaera sp. GP187]|nr:hypothetical protein SAMN05444166_5444 [Singulisphaera sp. GP187]
MAPLKKPAPTPRTNSRFDYVDKLPSNVPPIEHPFSASSPSDFGGPAEATYYFPIEVMPNSQDNATGVFFPAGFKFPDKINVILYFHGHKKDEFKTINEYWSGKLHDLYLREYINATGKQAVLIAPTMGAAPGSSLNPGMGIFANSGGADDFLAEVTKWICKHVPQYADKKRRPEIGNIVLAGHSGAGGILSQQVRTMRSPVCEVWGFDTMYGQGSRTIEVKGKKKRVDIDVIGEWLESALSHHSLVGFQTLPGILPIPIPKLVPTTRFYFYWVGFDDPVKGRSLELQAKIRQMGLYNVEILESSRVSGLKYDWDNHFGTVSQNFKKRVADAPCF